MAHNKKIKLVLLLLCLYVHVSTANICTKCKCNNDEKTQSFLIDCNHLSLTSVPINEEWTELNNDNNTIHIPTIVDFEYNEFKTIEQFPKLRTIIGLCFRHNQINSLAESVFINLINLKKLDLSHNELTGDVIRADVFRGNFDNARYESLGIVSLDLGYNRIHSLNSKAFEHLPDLVELHLNNNPLTVIDATTEMALGMPKALGILNLANTGLSDLPEHFTRSLKVLQEFYLNGNNFVRVPFSLAALGATLKKLNLNSNPMVSLDYNSFLGLRHLQELNISGCKHLREILPSTFAQLEQLRLLHLSYNFNLSYIDVDAFRELKFAWPIKELYMNHNAFSSLPPALLPWDSLEVLDIQDNPWRCDCQLSGVVVEAVKWIAEEDPDRAVEIRCDEPPSLKGLQLSTVDVTAFSNLSCTTSPRPSKRRGVHVHPLTIAILLLTTLVVVSSLLLLLSQRCVKRGPRFVRLHNNPI